MWTSEQSLLKFHEVTAKTIAKTISVFFLLPILFPYGLLLNPQSISNRLVSVLRSSTKVGEIWIVEIWVDLVSKIRLGLSCNSNAVRNNMTQSPNCSPWRTIIHQSSYYLYNLVKVFRNC
ncbi:hypothetical protein BI334_14920 [Moorena producens 3L]|nr:hypothetical protein BI334_14920 [Moorena producens 3L]